MEPEKQRRIWDDDPPKECELCREAIGEAFVDGGTDEGPWGLMCLPCHAEHGHGFGAGKGQLYEKSGEDFVLVDPKEAAAVAEANRQLDEYRENYHFLERLLGGECHRRIEHQPYQPLVVERLEGQPLVSLCRYGELAGDLMREPEIVFLTDARERAAKPVYFRNDFEGTEYATVGGHFGVVAVRPEEQQRLSAAASLWFGHLREQGFFERAQGLPEGEGPREEDGGSP
jgi:hypothetical protein